MADVYVLSEYVRSLRQGFEPRAALRRARLLPRGRLPRGVLCVVCMACGRDFKTERSIQRHRCEPEVRHG